MSAAVRAYLLLESLFGRALMWRIGRWMYHGSRRELRNDPKTNGEYALQRAWVAAQSGLSSSKADLRIVDVGANIGDWTVELLETLKTSTVDGFVIQAFEPAPTQRQDMIARCESEIALGRVVVDARGLAAMAGHFPFGITGDQTGTSALIAPSQGAPNGSEFEIETTTLDAVCSESGLDRLHLVKVDTEGNDFNVILGAKDLLKREVIEILQFEYNWRWVAFDRTLKNVFDFLAGKPYVIGRLTPEGVEVYDAWHPELERFIETNYIIAHRDSIGLIPHWRAVFDSSNTAKRL